MTAPVRKIIDGFSGLGCVSLGYRNELLANATVCPMSALSFAPALCSRTHPNAADLGEHLLGMVPGGLNKAMSRCSGSEADDTAMELLWCANTSKGEPNRRKIIGRARRRRANCCRTSPMTAGFACARPETG